MNEANAYPEDKPCPKCGYVRSAADTNPAWQCPKCQIAYLKFAAAPKFAARLVQTGRDAAAETVSDHSAGALIAANLVAAGIALAFHMTLRDMMLVYVIQSIIIGISYFIRVAALHEFSTEGVTMNEQPVEATAENKWRYAVFFLLHYGFFHAGYLVFVAFQPEHAGADAPVAPLAGYWLCALIFAANHAYSLYYNIRRDRLGRPNLGTLFFIPYLRIVPMHATILIGGTFFAGSAALVVFISLKTVADVLMHAVEHSVMRAPRALL